MLKPGQYYVFVALLSSLLFVGLTIYTPLSASQAALIAIGAAFVFRVLVIVFNWQTKPVLPWFTGGGTESTKSEDKERATHQDSNEGKP